MDSKAPQGLLFGAETDERPGPLTLRVRGQPASQGSKNALPIWANWRTVWARKGRCPTCGQKRHAGTNLVESNKKLGPWRAAVARAAHSEWRQYEPIIGPVAMSIVFSLERPKAHFRTGVHCDRLRDDAPAYPCMRSSHDYDLDKLTRAVLDALTGQVYVDDVQVVEFRRLAKVWAGEDPDGEALSYPGAIIRLWKVR